MKYKIGYDPAQEGGDEGVVCIDFNNDIVVTFSTIREHIYPYLELGVRKFIPINCNNVIAGKVELIVDEWIKNNSK